MPVYNPKLSVFTSCRNHGEYLKETIDSVLDQTFTDFEIVIVDGASTDNTLDVLKEYNRDDRVKWISEPDKGAREGFLKALDLTKGEYILCLPISDGLLDKRWFERCVNVLDNDKEISLVYGLFQVRREDDSYGQVFYSDFFNFPPPQKNDFFVFWLATYQFFPEINYVVRTNIFKNYFPKISSDDYFDIENPHIKFIYNFNSEGYLPYYIESVAAYSLEHKTRISNSEKVAEVYRKTAIMYKNLVDDYRRAIFSKKITHQFRNGNGEIIDSIPKNKISGLKRQYMFYKLYTPYKLFFLPQIPWYNLTFHFNNIYTFFYRLYIKIRWLV